MAMTKKAGHLAREIAEMAGAQRHLGIMDEVRSFGPKVPNAETRAAMEESRAIMKARRDRHLFES